MGVPSNQHTRECPYCHTKAQFNFASNKEPVVTHSARVNPVDEKSSMQRNDIAMYKCCVCGGPLFIRAYGTQTSQLEVYPVNIPTASTDIPEKIRNIYLEALRCFSVHAWNATATMCRRAVQECILEKGGTGKMLYNQIDDLATKRVITEDIKEWAHELRILGRDAAHADVPTDVGEKEAKFAVEFTEELLNYVYVLKARLTRRKKIGA